MSSSSSFTQTGQGRGNTQPCHYANSPVAKVIKKKSKTKKSTARKSTTITGLSDSRGSGSGSGSSGSSGNIAPHLDSSTISVAHHSRNNEQVDIMNLNNNNFNNNVVSLPAGSASGTDFQVSHQGNHDVSWQESSTAQQQQSIHSESVLLEGLLAWISDISSSVPPPPPPPLPLPLPPVVDVNAVATSGPLALPASASSSSSATTTTTIAVQEEEVEEGCEDEDGELQQLSHYLQVCPVLVVDMVNDLVEQRNELQSTISLNCQIIAALHKQVSELTSTVIDLRLRNKTLETQRQQSHSHTLVQQFMSVFGSSPFPN